MSDDVNKTKCLRCNLNFTSEKTLKIHQQEKHPQGVMKCFKCGLRFSNQERFRVHWNTKHVIVPKTSSEPKPSTSSNGETVIVDDDSDSNSQPSEAVPTKKRKLAPTSNRCKVCYKAFASQPSAKLHYERVHMDWTTECEVCKKRVKKNLYIPLHLRKHRLRNEITVERILEIQKENREKIQKKKNISKKAKSSKPEFNVKVLPNVPTACPDCQKVFISERVMNIHWARVHYVAPPKANADEQSDNDEKADSGAPENEPKACPKCDKVLASDGRMRIHYFQAHVKNSNTKRVQKKKKREKEDDDEEKTPRKTLPSIKSVADLRSKPPDIDFDSNVCPMCKKVFGNNLAARKHFKEVHHRSLVWCPYPQCLSKCSTVSNLRTHFSKCHPRATLPKEFEARRHPAQKQKIDDTNSTDGNKSDLNATGKCEKTPAQTQEDAKKAANETKAKKPANPLLKMFEKMREKNAQCPVVPIKITPDVIEIEEDQSEDSGGCFTLDFEHCSMCSKNFPTSEAAMMHYNNKHPDELQMCCECGMLVTNSRQIAYHFKTKHTSIVMPLHMKSSRNTGFTKELFDQFNLNKCITCKQNFDSKGDAQKHYIEEHELKFELCSVCTRSFRSEPNLLTHWTQHHAELKFVEFKAQTPIEVDDQNESDIENAEDLLDSVAEKAAENTNEKSIAAQNTENTAENTSKRTLAAQNMKQTDVNPTTEADSPKQNTLVPAANTTPKTKNQISTRNKRVYPFIIKDICPICDKQLSSRISALNHYKGVHLKNGIKCKMCQTMFANIDHVKQHWLLLHEDTPWEDSNDVVCEKPQKEVDDESVEMEMGEAVEMERDKENKNESTDITPKLNVVVSLVNIKDNLESLSPEMRKQFLKLSNEMDKAKMDPIDNEEKVSDSGHGSTANTTDEELSMDLSQSQPLDLSVQHERSPIDDFPDSILVKCETVNIKYESSADLVSSFDQAIVSSRTKISDLANDTDIIVKDEISIEEPTINE